jgi:hypothetical protein
VGSRCLFICGLRFGSLWLDVLEAPVQLWAQILEPIVGVGSRRLFSFGLRFDSLTWTRTRLNCDPRNTDAQLATPITFRHERMRALKEKMGGRELSLSELLSQSTYVGF